MKEILFINQYFRAFDHLDSGASNRSALFISALSQIGHVDVISFLDGEESSLSNCNVIFSQYVERHCSCGRIGKFIKLFAPLYPYLMYPLNKGKNKIILQCLEAKYYDYIAIRYIEGAVECGLLQYKEKLIIDVDDNPRNGCIEQSKYAKTLRNRIFSRLLSFSVDIMVKRYFSNVFCCFHSNSNQIPFRESIFLHNTSTYDHSLPNISRETPVQLLVVGLFHYGPNIDGVNHFLQEIFPMIKEKNNKVTLHIVGRIPDTLNTAWSCINGVKVCGYVEDLYVEYNDSRIIVVPIYAGTGSSVKVAEAIKMNRLCVSTAQGIRGYDAFVKGEDYLLAENDQQFAELILNSIEDIEMCNRLSNSAMAKFEKEYSKEAFIKKVVDTVLKKECVNNK